MDESYRLDYSNIPSHWEWKKIETIVSGKGDFFDGNWVLSADMDSLGKVRLLQLSDIGEGEFLDKSSKYINESKFIELKGKEIFEGDILISRMADPIGRSCIIPKTNYRMMTAVDVAVLRVDPSRYEKKFLNYMFNSNDFMTKAESLARGTTRRRITRKNLGCIEIPVPPLPEQQRIVNRIESLFEKIDKAETLINEAREGFEKRKEAILAKAFRGELTEKWREEHKEIQDANTLLQELKNNRKCNYEKKCLDAKSKNLRKPKNPRFLKDSKSPLQNDNKPNTWVTSFVYELGDVELGGTPSRKEPSYWNGDIPWISSGEVANNEIYQTKELITEEGLANSNAKLYPKGTVLIAMIGEGKTRGQSSLMQFEASTNQNVAGIVCNSKYINSKYIWYYLQYTYERNRNVGRGGNQPALNGQKVGEIVIDIAPYEEQCQIGSILDDFIYKERIIQELSDLACEIESIKKSVLAKAFRGKLGTNKPEEDSITVLL